MVSFSCEVCNDTLVKKKLMGHFRGCPNAYFTCIDCSTTFPGMEFQKHTSCISEAEKYEKALYRGKKGQNKNTPPAKPEPKKERPKVEKKEEEPKVEKKQEPNVEKKEKAKKEKDALIPSGKTISMAKVLKKLKKEHKKDKSELLEKMTIERSSTGEIILKLNV